MNTNARRLKTSTFGQTYPVLAVSAGLLDPMFRVQSWVLFHFFLSSATSGLCLLIQGWSQIHFYCGPPQLSREHCSFFLLFCFSNQLLPAINAMKTSKAFLTLHRSCFADVFALFFSLFHYVVLWWCELYRINHKTRWLIDLKTRCVKSKG